MKDIIELRGIISCLGQKYTQQNQKRSKQGTFATQKVDPLTWSYLSYAWNVDRKTITNWRVHGQPNFGDRGKDIDNTLSIIDCYETAKMKFNPRELFLQEHIKTTIIHQEQMEEEVQKDARYIAQEEGKAIWVTLQNKDKWICLSNSKLAQQPQIRDTIIQIMRKNPTKSFDKVAADIGEWCSGRSIARWFKQYEQSSYYVERVLPLLTEPQMKKQVAFCKHLLNYWGLPRQKYLWIHYDEKWFWGFVARCNAKRCAVLGLDENIYFAYHKNHINKVMLIAFVAYAFDGEFENGGDGIKLGLFRCQAAKIAKKQVRESRRTEDGRIVYDGDIIREKGEVFWVDTNVTGSDEGTSDNPKFSLKTLFEEQIIPIIERLIREEYPGYIPVIQGDNAGPHQDKTFLDFITEKCQEKGWHWEPQAPQMPHVNNLDLSVFPKMSKNHGDMLRQCSQGVAKNDKIWETAQAVWHELDSPSIARGFVLSTRIAQKVIDNKGSNSFLRKGGLHCDVRSDFKNVDKGIKPKSRS